MGFEGLAIVGAILVFVYFLIFTLAVTMYIFHSLGLYTLAKRRGIPNPGLAWVPVGNAWILGSLADQYMGYAERRETAYRKILLGLSIAAYGIGLLAGGLGGVRLPYLLSYSSRFQAFNMGGFIGIYLILWVVGVVFAVFRYIALYRLFKSCQPNNATLFLILSILISVTQPFILFAIRNKDDGMHRESQWNSL